MSEYYVYSGVVGGTGDGSTWANAYSTLLAAATSKAAGSIFYVASDHVENASSSFTVPGSTTNNSPFKILSVSRAGSTPPVAADLTKGAKINITGLGQTLTFNQGLYCYGLVAGVDQIGSVVVSNFSNFTAIFENCTFYGGNCQNNNSQGRVEFRNVIWQPRGSGNIMNMSSGYLRWIGGSIDVSLATPTQPLSINAGLIEGVDFSALTGSTSLINSPGIALSILNCKMPSGLPYVSSWTSIWIGQVLAVGTDATQSYIAEKHDITGDITTETTIVKTGGASDGTTGFSRKIVTAAGVGLNNPLNMQPIAIWNDTIGSSVNVAVDAISNLASGAFPNNDDIWIEVSYLGSSSSPLGSIAGNNPATVLTTHTAYTSSGATWGGSATGGAFKMSVAITPQKKGYIYITVKCAKPSTTFYIDPLAVLS